MTVSVRTASMSHPIPGSAMTPSAEASPLPSLRDVAPDLAHNPYETYLTRHNSDEGRRTMRGCLDRIALILLDQCDGAVPAVPDDVLNDLGGRFPWPDLRYEHMILLRQRMQRTTTGTGDQKKPWSASHVNKHLSAARGVLRECWRLGLVTAEDLNHAIDVRNVTQTREPAGRDIRTDEINKMLAACLDSSDLATPPSPIGIRDAAIIAALQSTGGRRSEVSGMRIELYDHGERSIKITGKGNKERIAYFHPGAVPFVEAWLAFIPERRGPLFRPVDRWGKIKPRHLSPRSIGAIVSQRRIQVGLPLLTAHDYRRTFVGDLLDEDVDLSTVQKLAGHANPGTTAAYDRRPRRQHRAAVDKLTLPSIDELRRRPRRPI